VISENIDDKNIRTFESNLAMLSLKIQPRYKEVALTSATDHYQLFIGRKDKAFRLALYFDFHESIIVKI
jgi:hypothetical protein